MSEEKRECVRRTLRTFFQAAIGAIGANLSIYVSDMTGGDSSALRNALFTLGGLALSAGIAALMNLPKSDCGD